jgi:hypothetical protein
VKDFRRNSVRGQHFCAVFAAVSPVDHLPSHARRWLLTDVLRDVVSSVTRPLKELQKFKRVALVPVRPRRSTSCSRPELLRCGMSG